MKKGTKTKTFVQGGEKVVTTITYYKPMDFSNVELVEKIFKVGLKDRHYHITVNKNEVEIIFHDHDNVFGFCERLPIDKFMELLDKEGLYLNLFDNYNIMQ